MINLLPTTKLSFLATAIRLSFNFNYPKTNSGKTASQVSCLMYLRKSS